MIFNMKVVSIRLLRNHSTTLLVQRSSSRLQRECIEMIFNMKVVSIRLLRNLLDDLSIQSLDDLVDTKIIESLATQAY